MASVLRTLERLHVADVEPTRHADVMKPERSVLKLGRFAILLAGMHVLGVSQSVQAQALDLGPPFAGYCLVDLTHVLDEQFPFIPVPNITYPFSLRPIATLEKHGVAANEWHIHEHLGTQIDAPNHFVKQGRALEAVRADELLVPLVVLDVRERAQREPDMEISTADIVSWERQHGRIPPRALVAMYSGWDERIGDSARYLQPDAQGVLHFPGFSAQVATFLARERGAWGLGVDTISFDPGRDKSYATHRALLSEDRLAVEALARLEDVPARGAFVFLGALRVRHATGGPVRVLALQRCSAKTLAQARADKLEAQLAGQWRSERREQLAPALYLTRQLTLQRGRWAIQIALYDSPDGPDPFLRGESRGRYRVLPGTQPDGALRAEFGYESRWLTPQSAQAAQQMLDAGCATKVRPGRAVDVGKGCTAFRVLSIADCPAEHDRVRIDGTGAEERLLLGARPVQGDLCSESRRPQLLGQPLLRMPAPKSR